jgi:CO/xanthine dehydrogenase Mo-binding subunit
LGFCPRKAGKVKELSDRKEDRESLQYVGKAIPLDEVVAKATGRIRFLADQAWGEALHVKLLLSEVPHGRVIEVVTKEAEIPGVVNIYSCFNTPRTKFNSQKWFVGQKGIEDQELFSQTVRFVGDPVAAVVAVDKKTATAAAKKIKIKYEPLPWVIDPEEALRGEVIVHSPSPAPVLELECGAASLRRKAFAEAFLVCEDRVETQKIHHAALETHAFLAVPDANGKITIYSPCQIVYAVRMTVARVLGLPLHKIRVIKAPVGGAFGGKQEVTFEPLCAYISLNTQKPVRLELDRGETMLATRTRTKTIGYVKTAVNQDGKILAREARLVVDTGAYMSNGVVISAAMGRKFFRLYRIPDQHYKASVVNTNTPVAGAARGYGSPQIHAITEIHLDHVARLLKMDPVEFRLKNLVHPYDSDPSGGPPLGNARILDCVEKGASAFKWKEKWARPPDTGRWRKGIGVACGTHGNGYYGAYQDFTTMTLRMLEDGGLVLHACLHDLGQGVETIMKQIVAEVMSVSPETITIPVADTDTSPYDIGCQASRVTFVCGACAMKVAENLRDLFSREVGNLWGCNSEEICLKDGMVWAARQPQEKKSYGEMAALLQQKRQIELIRTLTHHAPANPGSYAANFAEVSVDTYTGLVNVEDIVAVHDVGKAINPGFVEGQIHGGIQMGIGMALVEELSIDRKTGLPQAETLRKYHLINAPAMPRVRIFLVEKGEEHGPFGAKSVGELAAVPIVPAVVNAVNHALGTNLTSLPLTPEKILSALERP